MGRKPRRWLRLLLPWIVYIERPEQPRNGTVAHTERQRAERELRTARSQRAAAAASASELVAGLEELRHSDPIGDALLRLYRGEGK